MASGTTDLQNGEGDCMKHYISMVAMIFVADQIGLRRMNPWIGVFVLGVLAYHMINTMIKEML